MTLTRRPARHDLRLFTNGIAAALGLAFLATAGYAHAATAVAAFAAGAGVAGLCRHIGEARRRSEMQSPSANPAQPAPFAAHSGVWRDIDHHRDWLHSLDAIRRAPRPTADRTPSDERCA